MRENLSIPELTPKQIMRFEAQYIRNADNECWPWTGYCNKKGYGKFGINYVGYYAHRVALAIAGFRSNIREVRHLCNNPNCVNPQHLRFGTSSQNAADRMIAANAKIIPK